MNARESAVQAKLYRALREADDGKMAIMADVRTYTSMPERLIVITTDGGRFQVTVKEVQS